MQCPACHREVADQDSAGSICCADAGGLWHCAGCDQTCRGFAFAYAMCPNCGGKLRQLDTPHRVTPEAASIEGVRMAFEIELGGRDFYTAAAAHTTDAALHDMFGRLAKMEHEHIDTLVRRYHLAPPAGAEGNLHPGVLQAGGDETPDDPLELLEMAITLERRAEQFFRDRIDEAAPAAQALYRELAAEEGEHIALLVTELAALRSNRRGLL